MTLTSEIPDPDGEGKRGSFPCAPSGDTSLGTAKDNAQLPLPRKNKASRADLETRTHTGQSITSTSNIFSHQSGGGSFEFNRIQSRNGRGESTAHEVLYAEFVADIRRSRWTQHFGPSSRMQWPSNIVFSAGDFTREVITKLTDKGQRRSSWQATPGYVKITAAQQRSTKAEDRQEGRRTEANPRTSRTIDITHTSVSIPFLAI